jgi:2-methylisocitrate lyase-like PEP mutase family enzyme
MGRLLDLMNENAPLIAAVVSDPLSARLAAAAGFRSLYLGGGAVGYVKCVTEANVSLVDMVQAGVDIRSVCPLPLILDGTCGWGDPMHIRRTVQAAGAAGFCAIEIEDEVVPKRAHHMVGVQHLIPLELMVAKIEVAVASRADADIAIIGRTNAVRTDGLDEGLRRGEALRAAGSDVLWVLASTPDQVRQIGSRLGGPLMVMRGAATAGMRTEELAGLGYGLLVEPFTALIAGYRAMRLSYEALAAGTPDPGLSPQDMAEEIKRLNAVIGLPELLEIERQTVERA